MTEPDHVNFPAAFWLGVDWRSIRRSELLRGPAVGCCRSARCASDVPAQFFAPWHGLDALQRLAAGLATASIIDRLVMTPSFPVDYHARDLGNALARVKRPASCTALWGLVTPPLVTDICKGASGLSAQLYPTCQGVRASALERRAVRGSAGSIQRGCGSGPYECELCTHYDEAL